MLKILLTIILLNAGIVLVPVGVYYGYNAEILRPISQTIVFIAALILCGFIIKALKERFDQRAYEEECDQEL